MDKQEKILRLAAKAGIDISKDEDLNKLEDWCIEHDVEIFLPTLDKFRIGEFCKSETVTFRKQSESLLSKLEMAMPKFLASEDLDSISTWDRDMLSIASGYAIC